MTQLPPDAGTVCAALELDAGYLADVFRREAGTALRKAATLVEDDSTLLVPQLEHARHLLLVAEAFEAEWEHQEERDGAVGRNGGDSLTPPPHPSEEIVPESLRADT